MTSVSLNPSGDDPLQLGQNQFFISPNSQDSPTFFNIFHPNQTIEFGELRHQNHDHHDHNKVVFQNGSSSNSQELFLNSSSTRDPMEVEEMKNGHGSAKWMSSKMRLMKKMMRPGSNSSTDKAINTSATADAATPPRPRFQYQRHENRYSQRSPRNNNNNNSSNAIRVCSDCNTSTTPLWRSGPMGPKSLCNACGIRQRKARRAMMESENGLTTPKNITTKKEKKPRTNNFAEFKNTKYKPTETTTASSSSSQSVDKVETSEMSLKNNSDSEQLFPWDEATQAAVLLMSLSYGFVPIINYNYN